MNWQLFLTDHFYEELDAIHEYTIQEWGQATANEYLESINLAMQLIQKNPKVLTVREEISPHFCSYLVNKHWLICHISESSIIVLTILHTSRNVIECLGELEPGFKHEIEILTELLDS
mgnify:CR=1 FL=1|tara:strand:- start:1726 stop:2079 length:354 start_codon:yes stop_codon:yes gene_type:complete